MQSSLDRTGTSTSCNVHDGLPSSFSVPQPVTKPVLPTYVSSVRNTNIWQWEISHIVVFWSLLWHWTIKKVIFTHLQEDERWVTAIFKNKGIVYTKQWVDSVTPLTLGGSCTTLNCAHNKFNNGKLALLIVDGREREQKLYNYLD